MVETLFKTRLAHVISSNLGVHQDDYLHTRHYKQKVKNLTFVKVKQEINRQLDITYAKQPTKYYLKHHNHVPAWILFKNISLGSAINLFRFLNAKSKKEVASLLLPTTAIGDNQKIELLLNSLEAIRRFRNCAAHSLNFFGCRSLYNIPGNVLYTVLPNGILKREKGDIVGADKKSLKGIYGVLLMIALLLNDTLLVSSLMQECKTIFKINLPKTSENAAELTLINELKIRYKNATELPIDFEDKLKLLRDNIVEV